MPHVFLTCFLQMMPSYFWKPPKNVVNKALQYYKRCTYKPVKVFDYVWNWLHADEQRAG
jgi:hypothetical protein